MRDNIWTNPGEVANNGLDDDGNDFVDDVNGWDFHHNDKSVFDNEEGDDHATHVAGTIGATGNNGTGITGVNWQVRIMSVKVLGPSGGSTSNVISGYNYVRMMKNRGINIRVTNNSYGGCNEACGYDQATRDAIDALGDTLMRPRVDPDELARERQVILEEIRQGSDDPARSVAQSLFATAFVAHPYRRPVIGTAASVERIGTPGPMPPSA